MISTRYLVYGALAACSATAHAQSTAVLYGQIDEYLGAIESSSGAHVVGLSDGAYLRSRIGLRGSDSLGGGYASTYTLEKSLNVNSGTDADSTRMFDRQAWLGLVTPYGEVRLGRQNTSIFNIGGAIDYTERTTFGSVINTFGTPSRYDNDISYKTPRWAGVQVDLHYALPENGTLASGSGGASAPTGGNQPIMQLGVDVQQGPYRYGYAGLGTRPNSRTAIAQERIVYHNVYANYAYTHGTLYAAFVRSNNSTSSAASNNGGSILSNVGTPNNNVTGTDLNAGRYYNIYQLSADYRLTPAWRVGALYGFMHDMSGSGNNVNGANAGAFYSLSKRTTLYGFASMLNNHHQAGFRFSSSASPAINLTGDAINGQRLTGLQLGMLLRF